MNLELSVNAVLYCSLAALEALAMAILEITGEGIDMEEARAACIAMLRAWPRMDTGPNIYGRQNAIIRLPLPQEPQ